MGTDTHTLGSTLYATFPPPSRQKEDVNSTWSAQPKQAAIVHIVTHFYDKEIMRIIGDSRRELKPIRTDKHFDFDLHTRLHIIQSLANNSGEKHPSPPASGRGHDARSTRSAIETMNDKENSAAFWDRPMKQCSVYSCGTPGELLLEQRLVTEEHQPCEVQEA